MFTSNKKVIHLSFCLLFLITKLLNLIIILNFLKSRG
jgi:hypothetical protein